MARVTTEALKRAVEDLNKVTRNRYRLESAYGGWKLVKEVENSSALVEVTYGFVPKSQLYYTIQAILKILQFEEEKIKK
jgi:PHP family Zn ribbon phosphoesterase